MENNYFIDSDKLSEAALKKKHMLETDPSSRTDHMEYMEGMERIKSDIIGVNLTVYATLTNSSGYQLLILPAEVQHYYHFSSHTFLFLKR